MAFRRWFSNKGLPGWYAWIVVVVFGVMSQAVTVLVTIRINERSIERELRVQQATSEAAQRDLCELVGVYNTSYREEPPTTPAGKRISAGLSDYAKGRC